MRKCGARAQACCGGAFHLPLGCLQGLLFAKDFKRHCEAADALREALGTLWDEVQSVVDLLLR